MIHVLSPGCACIKRWGWIFVKRKPGRGSYYIQMISLNIAGFMCTNFPQTHHIITTQRKEDSI